MRNSIRMKIIFGSGLWCQRVHKRKRFVMVKSPSCPAVTCILTYSIQLFAANGRDARTFANCVFKGHCTFLMSLSPQAFYRLLFEWINFMMDYNQAPAREAATSETGSGNGKEMEQVSDDSSTLNRRFGIVDLWSIQRNARKFRIHSRISRM